MEEAARGARARAAARRSLTVTVPLVRSGIFAGAALVFLSAMKELPATLLLRPIGFETLATEIWKLTSVGAYSRAALPALLLIAVSAPFVYLLSSRHEPTESSTGRVSADGRPLRRRVPGDDLLPRLPDRRVPARPGSSTAIASRVAEMLGVSRASAGEMLKRLEAEGLVERGEQKEAILTETGIERAERVVRKHRSSSGC